MLAAVCGTAGNLAATLRDDARAALRQAGAYYHTHIAVHGGYVYYTNPDDLTQRWAEGVPNLDQIFVQPPGTPAVGLAFLQAYAATGEQPFLAAAIDAGNALVYGQLKSGGWSQKIDFNPKGSWVALYRNGQGSGQNNSALDDGQSQAAIEFMANLDRALGFDDPAIHEATQYALDALLKAQFPIGAFPQVWTGPVGEYPILTASYPPYFTTDPAWPNEGLWPGNKVASALSPTGVENYWDDYTLNDGLAESAYVTLRTAYEIYGDERHRDAIRRLGDFLIRAQMPEPQPAWAQQYTYNMQPRWARKFEPPAIVGLESEGVIRTLMKIHQLTGEAKYLEPVPRALAYLQSVRLPDGRMARYYEMRTNLPLYMYRRMVSGNWVYYLTYADDDLPSHYGYKQPTEVEALAADFSALQSGQPLPVSTPSVAELAREVRQILAAMDDQGRWISVYASGLGGHDLVGQPSFRDGQRYIDSGVFNHNMGVLSAYVAAAGPSVETPSPLAEATKGRLYTAALAAAGGAPPYTWALTAGALPAGLSLSREGEIGGTPTAAGPAAFTVQVSDSAGESATMDYALASVLPPPPEIAGAATLPPGIAGAAYLYRFEATGGTPPYQWYLASGVLPAGLSLSRAGVVEGAANTGGASPFEVRVVDADDRSAERGFTLEINRATFADWQTRYFDAGERADSSIGGAAADPDGDGRANLIEYALGTNPRDGIAVRAPAVGVWNDPSDGRRYVSLTVVASADTVEVTLTAEVSSDLSTWESGASATETMSDTSGGGIRTVMFRDRTPVMGGGRRFIRVQISQP